MRLLLADHQPSVRSALHLLLAQEPGMSVLGEAGNLEQALALTAAGQPELVILDWELPGGGGRVALTRMRALLPELAVIALSTHPEARRQALAAGVDAFVSKGDPPERLLATIHRISAKSRV